MSTGSVILIGGPETGKTNFIGRLWIALRTEGGALTAAGTPNEIEYVEKVVSHLHEGSFAPRTDRNLETDKISVVIPLGLDESDEETIAELVIPDVSGEVWENAVKTNELAAEWMARLENADGALLFLRALSPLNVSPMDWVNAAELMNYQGGDTQPNKMPTQVMLCELLRFLELKLPDRPDGRRPRIAIIVTAWDRLHSELSAAGPQSYIQKEFPLFAGRLADLERFDVATFAASILGGDPEADECFRDELLESDFGSVGFVMFDHDGQVKEVKDITLPVAWAIGIRAKL